MKLTEITIEKYKSITTPINIKLNDKNRVYTFIGKNGSGKTNILEAIRLSLLSNNRYAYNNGTSELKSSYKLFVEQSDIEQYYKTIDFNETSNEINITYDGSNPSVRRVSAPIIQLNIKRYSDLIKPVFDDYKNNVKKYIKEIHLLMESNEYSRFNLELNIEDESKHNTILNESTFRFTENEINRKIDSLDKYIKENFSSDSFTINSSNLYNTYKYELEKPVELYQINDTKTFYINPLIAKAIGITKDQLPDINKKLNKTIHKVNIQMKEHYEKIKKDVVQLNKLFEEFFNIVTINGDKLSNLVGQQEKSYNSFCQKIYDSIYSNCYFINNEDSILFEKSDEYQYGRKREELLNYRNPIIQALDDFLNKNHYYKKLNINEDTGKVEWESIGEFSKISESRQKYLLNKINSEFLSGLVPKFDRSEIKGYVADKDNNGHLVLYVIEKNDILVNFNDTSLGRRWYLTYLFVKFILKPGDYLFIDEPAAFLHPQAQIEFRKELEILANEKDVDIFITTHSPYMISNKWNSVINVEMTDKQGTQISYFNDEDEFCQIIKDEIGANHANDLLFNISKRLLVVEGLADKSCIVRLAKELSYELDDYKIYVCNGDSIIGICYLCITEGIPFKALLDYDNKEKPDSWLRNQVGYREYMKIINKNVDCVFTPKEGKRHCLEDCFSEEDGRKYFTEKYNKKKDECELKIDHTKIDNAKSFDEYTLNKFEQLFKELGITKKKNK